MKDSAKQRDELARLLAEFVAFEGHPNGYDELDLIKRAERKLKAHCPEILKAEKDRLKAWLKEQER